MLRDAPQILLQRSLGQLQLLGMIDDVPIVGDDVDVACAREVNALRQLRDGIEVELYQEDGGGGGPVYVAIADDCGVGDDEVLGFEAAVRTSEEDVALSVLGSPEPLR